MSTRIRTCIECGNESDDPSKECPNCGAPLRPNILVPLFRLWRTVRSEDPVKIGLVLIGVAAFIYATNLVLKQAEAPPSTGPQNYAIPSNVPIRRTAP